MVLNTFLSSAEEFKKRIKDMLLSSLFDIMFIVSYFFFYELLLSKASEHIIKAAQIAQSTSTNLLKGLNNYLARQEIFSAIGYLIIFAIVLFLLYTITQYLSWRIISKNKKVKFFKQFILVSTFLFIIYILISFLEGSLRFFARLSNISKPGWFFLVYLIFIYFSLNIYVDIAKNRKIKQALKKSFKLKPLILTLVIFFLFFLLDKITILIGAINQASYVIIGFISLFLLISFSKLLIYNKE